MATIYGNKDSSFWRVRVDYSYSQTNTTFTITTTTYLNYCKECKLSLKSNGGTFYVTIGSNKKSFSPANQSSHDSGYNLNLGSYSVTYNKQTYAQNITVTGYIKYNSNISTLKGTSSVSTTITIPASARSITYNANGGSGAPSAQTVVYGASVTVPNTIPTREGFNFINWLGSNGNTYIQNDKITLTENLTLTAQWKIKNIVTFDENNGTSNTSTVYCSQGDSITIPSTYPTRPLYDFRGWKTTPDGDSAQYMPGDEFTPSGNVTLYAHWHESYQPPIITGLKAYRVADDASGINPDVLLSGTRVYFDCFITPPVAGEVNAIKVCYSKNESQWYNATLVQGKIYQYSGINHLNTDEAENVILQILVTDYLGNTYEYNYTTYVSTEKCLWDAYSGRVVINNEEKVYQSFAIGTTARDITDSDIDVENGNLDVEMNINVKNSLKVGGVDYTLTDENIAELDSLLGGGAVRHLMDYIYPIGSIVESMNSDFDPNTLYSHQIWQRIKGKFLVGVDEKDTDEDSTSNFSVLGRVGGEKKHTLSIDEMPSHNHEISFAIYQRSTGTATATALEYTGATKNTGLKGGSQPHNNLPPYQVVYMWERIS